MIDFYNIGQVVINNKQDIEWKRIVICENNY